MTGARAVLALRLDSTFERDTVGVDRRLGLRRLAPQSIRGLDLALAGSTQLAEQTVQT
jgi:hypothetical protein